MTELLNKIDKYLVIQEKKDIIEHSMDSNIDLKEAIKLVRESTDKDSIISSFDNNIREEIEKLIEGGIIG